MASSALVFIVFLNFQFFEQILCGVAFLTIVSVKGRREFVLTTRLEGFFVARSSVSKFSLLIARVREDTSFFNAFVRFAPEVQENRQHMFRLLFTDGPRARLSAQLERFFFL